MHHNGPMVRLQFQRFACVSVFVLVAACSSANESGLSSQEASSEATDSTVAPITVAISATSTTVGNVAVLFDSDDPTLALDHTENAPALDAFAPSVMPDTPMGRVGYTRYVFTQSGDQIIPALIEGPKASQTRCPPNLDGRTLPEG